ncbi:MAG: hypothetical protein PHN64_03350 [Desulfovibrionaceae bacterium]|nr:hypothetical protein [Desulfovibrionaceae bacterium]
MTTFTITYPAATIHQMLITLRASFSVPVRICGIPNGFDCSTGMLTLRVAVAA